MPSKRKLASVVSRDGLMGVRGNTNGREQEVSLVEIDSTFARTLGLSDGQKITANLHIDPPLAHTVNIEPLTATDWEIIELHATFLELNLLSQIRALPNPSYVGSNGHSSTHSLTLHLSPTSTANITVTSLTPALPQTAAFAKIAPDAEVIVAPKTRAKHTRASGRENKSVTSTSRRSVGGKSGTSNGRGKNQEERPALFLRGLDRRLCSEYFDEPRAQMSDDTSLAVWVDPDVIDAKGLRGSSWAGVTVLKPAGLEVPVDPQKQQQEFEAAGEAGKPATKIVVRLLPWKDPLDSKHVVLSTAVCASLGCIGMVGGIVKIEAVTPPVGKSTVAKLKIYPFVATTARQNDGLKFGGESKAQKEDAAKRITSMYGRSANGLGVLDGPLTDGLVLMPELGRRSDPTWLGGIMRLDPASLATEGAPTLNWSLGIERNASIEVMPAIPKPGSLTGLSNTATILSSTSLKLVGINKLQSLLTSHLIHMSSVLLTGAMGAGKTSVARCVAQQLSNDQFFNVKYLPCKKLIADDSRIATIKETLIRLFMEASWCARLGGRSIVILDDLDKLCPAETELQVGNENGRSRQLSECICSIVRQYCAQACGVVLLATAQDKESLHNVIVGGHVVREIVSLKAPDKEGRRRILESVFEHDAAPSLERPAAIEHSRPNTADDQSSKDDGDMSWMAGGSVASRPQSSSGPDEGFLLARDVDFLDLAGQIDGYMPGDIILLASRIRSEALIRFVSEVSRPKAISTVEICKSDVETALKGFTPASLRNVTLQTSSTTFASIGGLADTRKVLLETLQYPTTYAPIFAQCPLRLRSGLLLYGYPGCGKTMLASAVAGECGLNFISVKGPEILNKYIGASEKSVRDLFDRAEAARPCVLFFDEFDSIAPKRGHDSTGVTDRVVNQLLTQMDGAEGLSGVYVLAATSRPDLIDPALLRPGRLDKSLICDLPDHNDRVDILRALGRKLKLGDDVLDESAGGLGELATHTDGYSGADLQALIYNAHLEAIHDVLGDSDPSIIGKKPQLANGRTSAHRDFIVFRYGEEEDARDASERDKAGYNRSKALAERANIATKLDSIKMARKKAMIAQRGGNGQVQNAKQDVPQQEVVIQWKHIMKSLKGMRPSISADERGRLAKIYNEFISARNGDMPSGQGGSEVGGRSSLM